MFVVIRGQAFFPEEKREENRGGGGGGGGRGGEHRLVRSWNEESKANAVQLASDWINYFSFINYGVVNRL